jgi:hypothetical protein
MENKIAAAVAKSPRVICAADLVMGADRWQAARRDFASALAELAQDAETPARYCVKGHSHKGLSRPV